MDQIKIGKFIAKCRKDLGLTQSTLAEKLGISDQAISKWENGKSLPDSGIMLELCEILHINVNELLSGERIIISAYDLKAEENLLEMTKLKELKDKQMLHLEYVMGFISLSSFIILLLVALIIEMAIWLEVLLIGAGSIILLIGICYSLRIEQVAGYYQCPHCHYQYVPRYHHVFLSPHIGRKRYLKCPMCGKTSYHKKIISNDD